MLEIVALGSRFLQPVSKITLVPYYLGFLQVMVSQVLKDLKCMS
jgi:hypothetical protein